MFQPRYPLYLASEPVMTARTHAVVNRHSGEHITDLAFAGPEEIEAAIAAGFEARRAMRTFPHHRRRDVLLSLLDQASTRAEELAHAVMIEVGKTIREARGEVSRFLDTLRLGAEEATRIHGEHMHLDISPRGDGYEAVWKRMPVGLCAFITPFNFPVNLIGHKIAPAIAAGCPFVLKPSEKTSLSAVLIGEMLAATDIPKGAFSILPCRSEDAAPLSEDPRIAMLSFTGSAKVGYALKAAAGAKRVSLELGGNAACIVERDADLEHTATRLTLGAFGGAGQSCISVQRVLVHEHVYDALKRLLVEHAARLTLGDPADESTDLGPLITLDDAKRIESWIQEAVSAGASVLCGGSREGAFIHPTWLEKVDPAQKVSCQEVFGPVALLQRFTTFDEALTIANDSEFGLQAGLFTADLDRAWKAFDELEVGGVVINDVPTFRIDSMPYGGVKRSGLGREGVRFALEEMTEIRLMVVNRRPGRVQ